MQTRRLGSFPVSAIGLGCMNLSHAYGTPPDETAGGDLLLRALDLGYTHFDTAAVYGYGANETLIGKYLASRRDEFVLASKCGIYRRPDGKREINNRSDLIREAVEDSLRRLRTEAIDLYYLHRWDRRTPIEDIVGTLADMVRAGKIRAIGLSEVSAATLRRAHAVHPIAAVQTEYSLWTRDAEIAVLDACRELGATFVAFSPLARGFLTGRLTDVSALEPGDLRRGMPRFAPEAYARNLELLAGVKAVADDSGCTMGQAALAWLLAQGDHIVPIPGTTSLDHLAENAGAAAVTLSPDALARLDAAINRDTVHGPRYAAAIQAEIDTETFA